MELGTLKDLYIHELKDLYSAEQQLVKALPRMAKAARSKELCHLKGRRRCEPCHIPPFRNARPVAPPISIQRLLLPRRLLPRSFLHLLQQYLPSPCIWVRGSSPCDWTKSVLDVWRDLWFVRGVLENPQREGANLLQMTLEEERATDQKLTKLAKSAINVAAAK
jgi:hypothetical protein